MVNTTSPPAAKSKHVDWINELSEDYTQPASQSKAAKAWGARPSQPLTLKTDKSLSDTRSKSFLNEIERLEEQYDLLQFFTKSAASSSSAPKTPNFKAAKAAVTKVDLSVPKNNETALAEVEKLRNAVYTACTQVGVGVDSILAQTIRLEKSSRFQTAANILDPNSPVKLVKRLESIREQACKNQVNQAMQELNELSKLSRQTTEDFSEISKEIDTTQALLNKRLDEIYNDTSLLQNARAVVAAKLKKGWPTLAEAYSLVSQLSATPVTSAQTNFEKDIGDVKKNVADKCKAVEKVIEEANKLIDDLSNVNNPSIDQDKAAQLLRARADLATYYDCATANCSLLVNTPIYSKYKDKKLDGLIAAPQQEQEQLLELAEAARESVLQTWGNRMLEAGPLVRFGQRILVETAIAPQEELQGIDSRHPSVITKHKNIKDVLAVYDEAIASARGQDYSTALSKLQEALDGNGSTLTGLQELQQTAAAAFTKSKVDADEVQSRAKTFATYLGETTTKDRIRFDDDAMDFMLGQAITLDADGEPVYSDRYNDMMTQTQTALAAWHKLRADGVDAFRAANRAFEGIPENFWPVEAVRVLATFRRAEADLQAEREAKELEQAIEGGLLSKALDKADRVLNSSLESKLSTGYEFVSSGGSSAWDLAGGILDSVKAGKMATMRSEFESDHPDLSESELEEKLGSAALDELNIDEGALDSVTQALNSLGAGIAVFKGLYDITKDGLDIAKAQRDIVRYDPETDSPVSLKLAEFERHRAIWHLIEHLADTILAGLGAIPSDVPIAGDVVSALGDIKQFAVEATQAYEYFSRLYEVNQLKKNVKYDPETMMELALANEANKLGLLGSKKTFLAATAVIKLTGTTAKAIGVETAAGDFGATLFTGFALKYGGLGLEYGGKFIFMIKVKIDDRNAKKAIFAAKADPTNINVVEPVFEKCTLYARFALASGAINGDPWARQYILSRGLTDKDLDNPNTSAAILREYLNVTFESKRFGDAQEDQDYGAAKQADKEAAASQAAGLGNTVDSIRARLQDVQQRMAAGEHSDQLTALQVKLQSELEAADGNVFIGTWAADSLDIKDTDFLAQYEQASSELLIDKQFAQAMSNQLKLYVSAFDDTVTKIKAADSDYAKLKTCLTKWAKDDTNKKLAEEKQTQAIKARTSRAEAMDMACMLGTEMDYLVQLATTHIPLANDNQVKHKVHGPMRQYLQHLANAVKLQYAEVQQFRSSSRIKMILDMIVDSPDTLTSQQVKNGEVDPGVAEANMRAHFASQEGEQALLRSAIVKEFEAELKRKPWDNVMIKLNAGTWTLKAAPAEAARALDLQINSFQNDFDTAKGAAIATANQFGLSRCSDLARTSLADQLKLLQKAKSDKHEAVKSKIAKKWKHKLTHTIIPETIAVGRMELAHGCNAVLDKAYSAKHQPANVGALATTTKLTTTSWSDCKTQMIKLGWKKSKTGIADAVANFASAEERWSKVPNDDLLQSEWLASYGKLRAALKHLPEMSVKGVPTPGVAGFKSKMLDELAKRLDNFNDHKDKNPATNAGADGWVLPDSQLRTWDLTEDGWYLMHELAERHGWEAHNSRKEIGRLFRTFTEAFEKFLKSAKEEDKKSARNACQALHVKLASWDPNKKRLKKRLGRKAKKEEHKGIMNYQKITVERLDQLLADPASTPAYATPFQTPTGGTPTIGCLT